MLMRLLACTDYLWDLIRESYTVIRCFGRTARVMTDEEEKNVKEKMPYLLVF